jgi:hypothetical protein
MTMPRASGIPTPKHHRAPAAHACPADRATAVKPPKGRTPKQPDYDNKTLRQPMSAGNKRLSSKR